MDKTDKTVSDAQLIERTIDFAGDLQKQIYDLQTALSESQKHLADANRGAQRQSGVNQLLVKELVQVKSALSEKEKECEILMKALELSCSIPAINPYATFKDAAWWANIFINKAKQALSGEAEK